MSSIVHQVQPTPTSCNQTCLAMILGQPIAEVMKVFPGEGMTPRELYAALDRCRVDWNAFTFGTLIVEGLYILAVPSLNIEAAGHSILIEWKGCWDESIVYDPNRGREGKRFYTTNKADGGVLLRWWTDVVRRRPGGSWEVRPSTMPVPDVAADRVVVPQKKWEAA